MTTPTDGPKVLVVVPCYQSARYVREAVESVRRQTVQDFKIMVVDDGSTDDPSAALADLLEQDHRVSLVRQANGGVASARNTGAREGGPSEYVLFLDADDAIERTMLDELIAPLAARPDLTFAYGDMTVVDGHGAELDRGHLVSWWWVRVERAGPWLRRVSPARTDTTFSMLFTLLWLPTSCVVMRRSAFDATGGFKEDFGQPCEDTLLFLQMALVGNAAQISRRLIRYRRHPSQNTAASQQERTERQRVKLYAYWRDPPGLTAAQEAVVEDARKFRDRRVVPWLALYSARNALRAGHLTSVARVMAGSSRIALRSLAGRG